jgi:hypothetical protein
MILGMKKTAGEMDNNTKWPLKHSNNYDPFYLFIIGRISLFETSHLANMLRAINRTKDAARRLELSGNIRRRRRPPCSRRIVAQRTPQRGWPFPSSPSPRPKSSMANRQSSPPPPGSSIHTQTRQKRGKNAQNGRAADTIIRTRLTRRRG